MAAAPSAARAGDPLAKIAARIDHDIGAKHPRVALLSFPYNDDRQSPGSTIVAERLTTILVERRKTRVIERHLLEKVLEEEHLSETGAIGQSSAKELGKILNVEFLITGTLQDLPEERKTQVNARAIDARTGEVVSAASLVIDKTWPDHAPRRRAAAPAAVEVQADPADEPIEVGYSVDRPGVSVAAGRAPVRGSAPPARAFRR